MVRTRVVLVVEVEVEWIDVWVRSKPAAGIIHLCNRRKAMCG